MSKQDAQFDYMNERFADVQLLRYRVPGFEELPLQTRKLLYYLYEASLCGRDITWDQNYRHNLTIRRIIEAIVKTYSGDRSGADFKAFMTYAKRVWFSNGIHHHYSSHKFTPQFDFPLLQRMVEASDAGAFPTSDGEDVARLLERMQPIIFDNGVDAKKVNKNADDDLVKTSAVNYYGDVSQDEVQRFYQAITDPGDKTAPSHGLNSKLVRTENGLEERTWKVGGMYTEAIEKMASWLEKAVTVAENERQANILSLLAQYYRSGDLKTFDAYNIEWVQDTESNVDMINGFIETYDDPLDMRGMYESIVSVKDPVATKRIDTIARAAQWFESNSPIADGFKKAEVKGISGAVINVVIEAGDSSPSTPIGVNLPNADWIREQHGSKSVNLANIVEAYNKAKGKILEEFSYDETVLKRAQKHGNLSDDLHTDLHEVIGHASGKLAEGVAPPRTTLKNYSSTLEEARADLVALYYLLDPQLIELGLMPSLETGKSQYDYYILNGLMLQLRRLDPGTDLEEDHMRNRQLIAKWAYEKGASDNIIARVERDGKTYFVINDYDALRTLFGQLLAEVQRIKSEGDYEAGKALVEAYGVRVDRTIHEEVLARFKTLDMAPYFGFINPKLVPHFEGDELADVTIEYVDDFVEQMLHYGDQYGLLPHYN